MQLYLCCQHRVILERLVMTAVGSVTAEVERHSAVVSMADAQMTYAAMAGQILRSVRLVCANSGLVELDTDYISASGSARQGQGAWNPIGLPFGPHTTF